MFLIAHNCNNIFFPPLTSKVENIMGFVGSFGLFICLVLGKGSENNAKMKGELLYQTTLLVLRNIWHKLKNVC